MAMKSKNLIPYKQQQLYHRCTLSPCIFLVNVFSLLLMSGCSQLAPHQGPDHHLSINELTIVQLHQTIASQQTTCHRITQKFLERIQQYDQSTGLNAIVLINPNALRRSQQLDQEFQQSKQLRPLHCAPVILKDNFDTADMVTTGGSMVLKQSIPPDDAFMVKKLRHAGAIILAKSNMAEWAFSPYYTVSSSYGITRNAYDLARVPAGSSGGTASAIAANFGIIGMGTDTGNSIRGPASHLALVGIRPTLGTTSRDGIIPLLLNRDIAGPLTRTVEDAAKVFNVIVGYDPADPITELGRNKIAEDYTVFLQKEGLKNIRLGVLRELIDVKTADPDIMSLFETAMIDLQKLGAIMIDPFMIDHFKSLSQATGFCSRFRYDINQYFQSLGSQSPVKTLQEIHLAKQYDPASEGAMQWAMSVSLEVTPEQQNPPCVDVQGDPRRRQFLNAIMAAMQNQNIDAIIYPSWSNPARRIGDLTSPHGNNSPIIAPHTGQPAISVPMGFTPSGLPAGLQILGKPFTEGDLFKYAYAYEQATQHRKSPSRFP